MANSAVPWVHYTECKLVDTVDESVAFVATYSQPTKTDPVPRANARVWLNYYKNGANNQKGPVLTYRFETHNLTHAVSTVQLNGIQDMLSNSSDNSAELEKLSKTFYQGNPLKRINDVIKAKTKVSSELDANTILNGFNKSLMEWRDTPLPAPLPKQII